MKTQIILLGSIGLLLNFGYSKQAQKKVDTPSVEAQNDIIAYGFGAMSGLYSAYANDQNDCFGSAWQVSQDLVKFSEYQKYTFKEPIAWITYFVDAAFFAHDLIYSLQNCGYSIAVSVSRQSPGIHLVQAQKKLIPDIVSQILKPIMILLEGVDIYLTLSSAYKYFLTKHITSFIASAAFYLLSLL
ncbi:UNKNOWN [Stylonychia lemnae]|uniref:Uncharacterized protein n=1 Tax=Stylonychia lemnae TaxID=5949 RepID=A0A078APS9_STYLE|nr:UNKNOWN [Stylonychia lemnae]|eukprot:CDW82928.1 UNKNOWN [Stylonychia lemnae]